MLQYLILAYDGDDKGAFQRRMDARPSHFEMAKELKKRGRFVMGGAMLDDRQNMIGSMMVVQFEKEDELVEWMNSEPYVTGDVWKKIEIKPFRVADV